MSRNAAIVLMLCAAVAVSSCRNRSKQPTDTVSSGVIKISADESFRPLIQQEIDVFEGLYPAAGIIPEYTSEVEAINLLIKDSVRLAVSTRKLTQPEINTLNEKKLFPKEIKIATDGIALITNKQNTDSMLSLPNLTKILTGKITKWKELDPQSKLGDIQVVFDNANSSTLRDRFALRRRAPLRRSQRPGQQPAGNRLCRQNPECTGSDRRQLDRQQGRLDEPVVLGPNQRHASQPRRSGDGRQQLQTVPGLSGIGALSAYARCIHPADRSQKRTGLRLHHFHKLGPRTAYHLKIRHRSRHPVDPAGERP